MFSNIPVLHFVTCLPKSDLLLSCVSDIPDCGFQLTHTYSPYTSHVKHCLVENLAFQGVLDLVYFTPSSEEFIPVSEYKLSFFQNSKFWIVYITKWMIQNITNDAMKKKNEINFKLKKLFNFLHILWIKYF